MGCLQVLCYTEHRVTSKKQYVKKGMLRLFEWSNKEKVFKGDSPDSLKFYGHSFVFNVSAPWHLGVFP